MSICEQRWGQKEPFCKGLGFIVSCVCTAAALASIYLGAHGSVAIAFVGVPMATIVKSFLKK